MPDLIYLDYNASTPPAPPVSDAMQPYLAGHYGNPHTSHWAGKPAHAAIQRARGQVAAAIGCDAGEVCFTGGASEANNWALKGFYFANRQRGDHLIGTQVEHASVKAALQYLERAFGAKVTLVPVDGLGRVNPTDIAAAITPRTLLISVMHANNEVGTIQPIEEIGEIARRRGVAFHCDAAQSLGKIPVRVDDLRVDMLSLAAHKCYGPKGVGALYIRSAAIGPDRPWRLDPLIHGAGQEEGRRSGTENTAWIVGFGAACELLMRDNISDRLREMRDYLWHALRKAFGDRVVLCGHPELRLPNTLNVGFRGVIGAELLDKLDGVAASPGAACHYGDARLSSTLAAMDVDPQFGRGAIRWSVGRSTTPQELDELISRLKAVLS
ncbi:Cysteine desulfurase [Phycisphaerae bacterium RAS1]|nr:Cysteine desulfurase [Phycisphaerae bacterium RAS1]